MKYVLKILLPLLALLAFGIASAQKVGIGTNAPTEMLDVNGRLRLRHENGQTAGIYFNSPSQTNRSFVGIMDANYMGFWGAGTNWNMVMNMTNGQLGIGTTSPTARLDVNGTLRIRDEAKAGAVLTAFDNQGNMGWVGPVYFVTQGSPSGNDVAIAVGGYVNYTKIPFANPDINEGNGWSSANNTFTAPVGGIYHFSANVQVLLTHTFQSIRLIRRRNNANTVLYQTETATSTPEIGDDPAQRKWPVAINLDTKLNTGDIVWLEMSAVLSPGTLLKGDKAYHSFSGQLVVLQ